MKIVLFHPVQLPPKDYGGVERVVEWLARGLVERGHEVWVGALRGSRVPAGTHLLPFESDRRSAWDLLRVIPSGADVVHFMAPPEQGVLEQLPCPYLLTVHGNGRKDEQFPKNTVFLSQNHARRHGHGRFVYNGLDPDEFRIATDRGNGKSDANWLFFSKTQWRVKNVRGAIRLCDRVGARLSIAGGDRPHLLRWKIRWSGRHDWVGPVGGEKKTQLLSGARGLIFPVLWEEPFGLVVVEALMSGIPVLAPPVGSLPELIAPHVGALIPLDDESQWTEWLSKDRLPFDPEACRAWAVEHFHFRKMAERYEHEYLHAINSA